MSLVQHVTSLEGADREEALVDLFLQPLERQVSLTSERERRLSIESARDGPTRSVRRIISYDALKPPEENLEEYGGVTPYNVSTAKRVGEFALARCSYA